ncbi:MAG TPA: D-Ala-D-Ala carboxypeptidase family metallohydrolase [Polyangiaceae bacterium]|nr:D-Ala-D-Ala carboxypeptidase family metallohydrolase [Polyangiaceae bacterium]
MRRLSSYFALSVTAALAATLSIAAPARALVRRAQRAPLDLNVFGPTRPLTETAWLVDRVGKNRRFELGSAPLLTLLERYVEPGRDRPPEWQSFWHGRYGRNNFQLHPRLTWFGSEAEPPAVGFEALDAFSSLELRGPELAQPFDFSRAEVLPDWSLEVEAPEPEFASASPRKYCPRWKLPRAVSVVRYDGAEWARLPLVDCQGAIAPDALDRLSVLARPPATPEPEFPLPLEPEDDAPGGEWLPRVKLLHPRVIWAVQKIAEAFPNRSIFIMSGYRRDAHGSYHQKGRALDLYVTGVENADLFRFCRTLNDVGCGFYPNNKFVHVDVRPYGTHRVAWVDVSSPGEPSQYVTSWPGVLGSSSELSAESAE